MNVTLVPFGNSKFNGTELECQHGKDECTANSWEQCAITLYPQFSTHWPFYLCVETAAKACGEGAGPCVLPKIEGCATGAGLDYTMLSGCVGDKRRASRLQHEFAALTPSDHSYVPWVVVEGKPLKNSEALVKHVCKKYTGANKPAACAKAEAETVADAASTSSDAACPVAW
jgi:interferon gamma-inducible protein 30